MHLVHAVETLPPHQRGRRTADIAQSFNRSVAQKCGLWGLCGLTSPCYARKRERKEKKKEEYIGNEYDLTRITSLTSIFI